MPTNRSLIASYQIMSTLTRSSCSSPFHFSNLENLTSSLTMLQHFFLKLDCEDHSNTCPCVDFLNQLVERASEFGVEHDFCRKSLTHASIMHLYFFDSSSFCAHFTLLGLLASIWLLPFSTSL